MASENPSWGEERTANELLLKLGIRVSPRTVSKYLPKRPTRRPRRDMRWSTFLRLHAQGIIACSRQDKPGKGGSYVSSGNHSMESSGFDSHPEKVNHRPEASLACKTGFRKMLTTDRKPVLHASAVTHYLKRRRRILK